MFSLERFQIRIFVVSGTFRFLNTTLIESIVLSCAWEVANWSDSRKTNANLMALNMKKQIDF
jgi:hypothetical protein